MNLKELLEKYRDITLELINRVERDEDLQELLNQRKNIINNIESLEFEQEEFKALYLKFEIQNLDDKLQKEIVKEQKKIREKINFIKVTRNARAQYENTQFKPTFFNKKI